MSEELIAISKFFKTAKLALVSNYMFYVDHPPHTPAPFLTAYLSIMKLPSRPTYLPTYLSSQACAKTRRTESLALTRS